jgi:hypothetical protein
MLPGLQHFFDVLRGKIYTPRILIMPTNIPFEVQEIQIPILVSFAMSINEFKDQTLGAVRRTMLFSQTASCCMFTCTKPKENFGECSK